MGTDVMRGPCSPSVCTCAQRRSMLRVGRQAGTHEADIVSFVSCSGDSFKEQCTRCDADIWSQFIPASRGTCTNSN